MSFEIAAKVWDYQGEDLNGIQKAILSRMAWYASYDGENVYPSAQLLSEQTSFCLRTVMNSIKHLKENNFLIACGTRARGVIKYRFNLKKIGVDLPCSSNKRKSANSVVKLAPQNKDISE